MKTKSYSARVRRQWDIGHAKRLFARTLEIYKVGQFEQFKQRSEMVEHVRKNMEERLRYTDEEDEYVIASKWFLRLESYINNQLSKENN